MSSIETVDQKNEKFIENLVNKKQSRSVNEIHDKSLSIGDKVADKTAEFIGSWPFILSFVLIIAVWITINVVGLFNHFDKFPFILLNLALSCVAALQAPLIMMSQKRQEERDRIMNEQDFQTNIKAEILIEEILKHTKKIEQIERKQTEILEYIKNK